MRHHVSHIRPSAPAIVGRSVLVPLLGALLIGCALPAGRSETPEQFRVWAPAGPAMAALPDGYTEDVPDPDAVPPLVPSIEDRQQGYVLFSRDALAPVPLSGDPAPSERAQEMRATAARGEMIPLSFAIHALDRLENLKVTVSDLRGPGGAVIAADQVDVRVVRPVRIQSPGRTYRTEPFLLEKRDYFGAEEGANQQVWLTLKAPADATPGDYAGSVSIQAAGRPPGEVKIGVRVLPFSLPEPSAYLTMYFYAPESDALLMAELTDLREHGIYPDGFLGARVKSRDRHFGEDDAAWTMAQNGRVLAAVRKIYPAWCWPMTYEIGTQVISNWDVQKGWESLWPHSTALDSDFVKSAQIGTTLDRPGVPLRLFAMDEAGAHNLLDEAAYYYGLAKQKMPQIETSTTIGGGIAMGVDELGKLGPVVDFFQTNRFTPEIARVLADRKKPFGVYNGTGNTAAGARYFFGFYGWKTAAQEVSQWVYHFGNAGLTGLRADDEGFVYETPEGPLPTIAWEAVRQGVDDFQYLDLLASEIAVARRSGKPGGSAVADEAGNVLRSVLEPLPMTYQALASEDRTPPPPPSQLRKWRQQIVEQIMKLQAIAPGTEASRAPPVRSPFDMEWRAPKAEPARLGAEMLPAVDFAQPVHSWHVEVWNGAGTSEADTKEQHGGKASMCIRIPPEAPAASTTVLVWPSWGAEKERLNVALEGDRTYAFSAWVKVKGRTLPPSLRVSLPDGLTAPTRSSQDAPSGDGWQLIRTEVSIPYRVTPTYLAVWVQGPGTVWINDLSLREVIPPPVQIALDQGSYDSQDRVGRVTVEIPRRSTPYQVRLAIVGNGDKPAAVISVPFRAEALVGSSSHGILTGMAPVTLTTSQFVFDPSALAPGHYDVKVELIDTRGGVMALKMAGFERIAE